MEYQALDENHPKKQAVRSSEEPAAENLRTLGVFAMVGVGFFWVSGGGYGNEVMVGLDTGAPPATLLVVLCAIPIVYCLPVALMVAELASAIPEDAGASVWITRTWGWNLGMHNAYWSVVAWIVDSAVYPVLAAKYIVHPFAVCSDGTAGDPSTCNMYKSLIATGIVVVVTAMKSFGMSIIVKLSSVLAAISVVPFLVFICGGMAEIKPQNWTESTGPTSWVGLTSFVLWVNSGFFGVGALAGQMKEPVGKTFTQSTAALSLLAAGFTILPLLVSLSMDNTRKHYDAGYFGTLAAKHLGGQWASALFQVGAFSSNVGLFNAQMIQSEVSLQYLQEQLLPARFNAGPKLVSVLCGLVCCALVWLPFTFLVQASMLLFCFPALLIIGSFFALRWQEPLLERPFCVPGGWPVAVLIAVVPIGLSVFNLVVNVLPSSEGFEERLFAFVGVTAAGCIVHAIAALCTSHTTASRSTGYQQPPLNSQQTPVNVSDSRSPQLQNMASAQD